MILFVFLAFFILQTIEAMNFRQISPEEFNQQYFPTEDIKTIFIEEELEILPKESFFFTTDYLDLTKVNRIIIKQGGRLKLSNLEIKVNNLIIEQAEKDSLVTNLKEIAEVNCISIKNFLECSLPQNFSSKFFNYVTFSAKEDFFYKEQASEYFAKCLDSEMQNPEDIECVKKQFKMTASTKYLLINDNFAQEISTVHLNKCTINIDDKLTFLSSVNLSGEVRFEFTEVQKLSFINPLLFELGLTNFERFYQKVNFTTKNLFLNTDASFSFTGSIDDIVLIHFSPNKDQIVIVDNAYLIMKRIFS